MLAAVIVPVALAHDPDLPPEGQGAGGIEQIFGQTNAGYGYFSSSEAEANRIMKFGCSRPQDYVAGFCKVDEMTQDQTHKVMKKTLEPLVLDWLRNQYFEYAYVQNSALRTYGASDGQLKPPTCVDKNSAQVKGTGNINPGLVSGSVHGQVAVMAKIVSAHELLSTKNMLTALAFSDRLDKGLEAAVQNGQCLKNKDADGYIDIAPKEGIFANRCGSMIDNQKRLKAAHPELFGEAVMNLDRDAMRSDVYLALGKSRCWACNKQKARELGLQIYDAWRNKTYQAASITEAGESLSKLEKSNTKGFVQLSQMTADSVGQLVHGMGGTLQIIGFNQDLTNELGAGFISSAVDIANLGGALESIQAADKMAQLLRKRYAANLAESLTKMCDFKIDDFVKNHPNVVRQALIAMSAENPLAATGAKAVLCEAPAINSINPQGSCDGVQADKKNKGVEVHRKKQSFPYGSTSKYTIVPGKGAGDPDKVVLAVDVIVDPAEGVSEKDVEQKTNDWTISAKKYYDKQARDAHKAGKIPKPMEFQFVMNVKTDPAKARDPKVIVHGKCYRSDMPCPRRQYLKSPGNRNAKAWAEGGCDATDCAKVHAFMINKCAKEGGLSPEQCVAQTPPQGDPKLNRADSGNYTLASPQGTINHELGHLMGLEDEYQDPTYPFNLLGEHDSLLTSGKNPDAKLYPRHFERIREPLECAKR